MIRIDMEREEVQASTAVFRACGSCGQTWRSWEDFVRDPGVRLLGLQAIMNLPDANLLVFEHRCGSSVSVLASRFRQFLPDSQDFSAWSSLRGTDRCSGHCFRLEDLQECDQPCINARDRRLILRLLEMKRQANLP
jgi:hypothetical protein